MERRTTDRADLESYASGDDPFTFLVVEQIIKERSRRRIPEVKPSELFWSHKRRSYQAALDAYAEVEHYCDMLWASLTLRLMQVQVEITTLPYEKELERRRRAEEHQDQLQDLRYQQEIQAEYLRLQGIINPQLDDQALAEATRQDKVERIVDTRRLDMERGQRQIDLDAQRELFEKVTKMTLEMTQKHEREMQELQQKFELLMATVVPDKTDPEYVAKRRRDAYQVYADMIKDVMSDPDTDPDQRHREIQMIFDMAMRG